MADGSQTQVISVAEVTYNTTPANSTAWKTERFTSWGMKPVMETENSEEVMGTQIGLGNIFSKSKRASGSMAFEFAFSSFDHWLEMLLGGTWASNVLVPGTTKRSFSIQEYVPDLLTTSRYLQFRGCIAKALSLNFAPNTKVTGSLDIDAGSIAVSTTSAVGTGSVAARGTSPAMRSGATLTNVLLGGASTDSQNLFIQSMAIKIQRETEGKEVFNNASWVGFVQKLLTIGIDLTAYFDSAATISTMLADTETTFAFTIADSTGDNYTFSMPRCRITKNEPAEAFNATRMQSLTITPLVPAAGAMLTITRTDVA